MVDVQKWLDENYPKDQRSAVRKLDISHKNFTGSLDLDDFVNLEELFCNDNRLTSLKLDNCLKLKRINCGNNNFSKQKISLFSRLVNLEYLNVNSIDQEKINQGVYNRFCGSLEPLKNLTKLRVLNISNTDIDSGLEYLSEDIEEFYCLANREDAKCKAVYNLFEGGKSRISGMGGIRETGWIENFSQKLQKYKEIKDWIDVGVKLYDYEFVIWLRDTKNLGSKWITNYQEDYQILSERFKKYGLCSECNQLNTGEQWCQLCNASRLQKDFSNWTSHNLQIDQFIQKYQLQATDADKFLEWIPYKQFTDIEYLAEGGFGKVYKAKWKEGNIHHWDNKKKQWQREKDEQEEEYNLPEEFYKYLYEQNKYKYKKSKTYREVALKILNNSSGSTDFLQETAKHKDIDDWFNNIVPCYGLSQDPQTGNYLMVMQYMPEGNLRKYLTSEKITLADKLKRLNNIIQGLKDIHQKNLIHRDFHSGNILNDDIHSFITDLGLCKPVNEANQEEEIYGVLPYVAPEVLRKNGYTSASDIYSLGMVAYEIFANSSPYLDRNYDTYLALDICGGLRPNIDELKIPQLLKDLIKKCWDDDPTKRPTAQELEKILRSLPEETEFANQLQAVEEEYNQMSQNSTYKPHPTATMNSKLINTKQITHLLQQKAEEYNTKALEELALNLDELEQEKQEEASNETKQEQTAQILHCGTPGSSKNS